jgi:hypothetical protein
VILFFRESLIMKKDEKNKCTCDHDHGHDEPCHCCNGHDESCSCGCHDEDETCNCSTKEEKAKDPQGPFCQSCAMPLMKPEDFGTNADGSKNKDYCIYCFKDGQFTEPNLTVEEMMEMVEHMLIKVAKVPEEKAKVIVQILIPQLKRWREKVK